MIYEQLPPRESDQRVFVADVTKVKQMMGWQPQVSKSTGIRKMIAWVSNN
jgi:CDP-paratose 2-epimerase